MLEDVDICGAQIVAGDVGTADSAALAIRVAQDGQFDLVLLEDEEEHKVGRICEVAGVCEGEKNGESTQRIPSLNK